ncbi:SOS-response transcriptional repressor LexA [Pseudomonas sp. JUb42]|uniref:S24 family peptidase n=1 Tax=Pseudomonas sp. JUb42 TaxID=2940611 RepID=UPI0021698113|nr:S24 family peptidase [Pseudomonas sp. JUb42]MCS3467417.1 SOS-response transcriptional repressor LexA [Pseudomonas sp. JUb42]
MNISSTRLRNFRHILAERKLRLTDIADRLGKAPAQVSAFGGKNPTKGIGNKIAREIESVLDLSPGSLDFPNEGGKSTKQSACNAQILPVLDAIAATEWCKAPSTLDLSSVTEWLQPPGLTAPTAFVYLIEGISMDPVFSEGDKIVIDPSAEVVAGNYVAVVNETTGRMIVRQLRHEGEEKFLYATNNAWPDRIIRMSSEWKICGRAKWRITNL